MGLGQEIALIKALGGGSSLPPVTASDNGSELIVKGGEWAKQQKKFLVTLTPTSLDYSGTMDKTVAEINAAYEAGQEIWFRLPVDALSSVDIPVSSVYRNTNADYFGMGWSGVANGMYVAFGFEYLEGSSNEYSTTVYSLTPAS